MANARQKVLNTLARVASEHGLPYDMFYRFAHIESSFDPRARTGSYKGLFQITSSDFRRYGGGNIYDPEDNARAFANLIKTKAAYFQRKTGITPQGWMLYLTHQQGIAGGPAHISKPTQPAWLNMYNTPEGRRKGVRWAKRAIWGNVPKAQKRRFGRVENLTSGEFVDLWQARYDRASPKGATFKEVAFDPNSAKTPDLPERPDQPDKLANFKAASKELKLNSRERRLYQRHLKNLFGDGDREGTPSSLLPTVVKFGRQFYLVPTVWNGKRLSPEAAELEAKKIGLRNFPKYRTEAAAEARYKKFASYIDRDLDLFEQLRHQEMATVPARNGRFSPVPTKRKLQDRLPWDGVVAQVEPAEVDSSPPADELPELPADLPPEDETDPINLPGRRRFLEAKKAKAPTGGFDPDLAERAFGSPFGELYARPDQGERLLGSIPDPPPLLRDIFGSG